MARVVTIQFTTMYDITGGFYDGKAFLLTGTYNGVLFELYAFKLKSYKYPYDSTLDYRYQISDEYKNNNTLITHEIMDGSSSFTMTDSWANALGYSNKEQLFQNLDGRSSNPYFNKNNRTLEFRLK